MQHVRLFQISMWLLIAIMGCVVGCNKPRVPREELGEVVTDLSGIPGMEYSYECPRVDETTENATDSADDGEDAQQASDGMILLLPNSEDSQETPTESAGP